MSLQKKSAAFRALHVPGTPLVLFNVWDAGSAKAVAAAGAKAIATSSWAVANANGFPDGEAMPRRFTIDNLTRIAASTELPVSVDLEAGYGESPEDVAETVQLAIDAGAIGCNLEDSFPADGTLRKIDDQVARIQRARETANAVLPLFFINSRTDVFFQTPAEEHTEAMLAAALERAHAYAEAGVSGIFMPGLVDPQLIAQATRRSPLPLNIMAGDATPSLRQLAELGVARISYGPDPYLTAMSAVENAAGSLLETQMSRV